jgi:glycosyltransferase involved in cell wall biosynthesis
MESLAAQFGPPGSVRFAGFRSDINRCMRGLDLLLHAPRLEAFGLVIIEAMATALPVVASRIGGIPDLVRQGTTGLLAKPEDPESLAACLEQLLNNPTFVESMGAEARRVALAEYGLDLYARRYAALYDDLAAHRPPNPRLLDIQTTL